MLNEKPPQHIQSQNTQNTFRCNQGQNVLQKEMQSLTNYKCEKEWFEQHIFSGIHGSWCYQVGDKLKDKPDGPEGCFHNRHVPVISRIGLPT